MSYQILNGILERVSDGFVALDAQWRYVFVNQKAAELLMGKPEDLIGKHIWTEFPEGRERQVSSIYATVGDVIFQVSIEGEDRYKFTSVNKAFLDKTGLQEGQIVGKGVDEVIPEPSLSLVLNKYREAVESRAAVTWEETTTYPTGTVTGVVSVSPLIDSEKCTRLVGVVHDVTARKRMEEELRQLNAEPEGRIAERTQQFEEAAERALEADRLKSAFLATMSHELRTPLNSDRSKLDWIGGTKGLVWDSQPAGSLSSSWGKH